MSENLMREVYARLRLQDQRLSLIRRMMQKRLLPTQCCDRRRKAVKG